MVSDKERISGEWLGGFGAYQNWFESLKLNSRKDEISSTMRMTYDSNLRNFIRFLRAGGDSEASPDSITAWVKEKSNAKKGKEIIILLNKFSLWLQGKDVEGYEKRVSQRKGKFVNQGSADNIAHGTIRGLFTHNEILLPKSGRKKKVTRSKTKKNDESYAIFKPGKNGKEVADYELFRQFLSTLNIHDQTIIMSILSTSQDPGDVLSLNIDFVLNQPEGDRLYWEGERLKTGEGFRTFFSKETTKMLRRYVTQERTEAPTRDEDGKIITKDKIGFDGKVVLNKEKKPVQVNVMRKIEADEPLFVRAMDKRITTKHLSENCKNVADKMGLINGETQHPFRPKRMRSIFRSACSIAGIEKGYINIFMGHKTDISDSYMEKPRATLELRYEMTEAYLTVFSGDTDQQIIEMKEKVTEYSERQDKAFDLMYDVRKENEELREQIAKLTEDMYKQVKQLRGDMAYKMGEVASVIQQLVNAQRGLEQSTEVWDQIDSDIELWDQIESKEEIEPNEDAEREEAERVE